jgi:beta-lactamase class A
MSSRAHGGSAPQAEWVRKLQKRLDKIDARYAGELGVYVKVAGTAEVFSYRGDEWWYLASGVKVPVAVAVLQQVDNGTLSLDDTVILRAEDYVDGAGPTNWHPPGSTLTVRYLFEQMLIHSDNTATDLLIGKVGIDRVNQVAKTLVTGEFGRITTLADVRRHAYSAMHASAFQLQSKDLLALKSAGGDAAKVKVLSEALHIEADELKTTEVSAAFAIYYASRLNSAPLETYGQLLERLEAGAGLSPQSRQYLFGIMAKVKTGANRLRAGFPKSYRFAHKTGTQLGRICDFGVVENTKHPGKRVIVAACSRGSVTTAAAENALRAVGVAITKSGVLKPST